MLEVLRVRVCTVSTFLVEQLVGSGGLPCLSDTAGGRIRADMLCRCTHASWPWWCPPSASPTICTWATTVPCWCQVTTDTLLCTSGWLKGAWGDSTALVSTTRKFLLFPP